MLQIPVLNLSMASENIGITPPFLPSKILPSPFFVFLKKSFKIPRIIALSLSLVQPLTRLYAIIDRKGAPFIQSTLLTDTSIRGTSL